MEWNVEEEYQALEYLVSTDKNDTHFLLFFFSFLRYQQISHVLYPRSVSGLPVGTKTLPVSLEHPVRWCLGNT
jgi:hypothetical protein